MNSDANFSGKLVFIGFCSITKANILLLSKEHKINYSLIIVISKDIQQHQWFDDLGVAFIQQALTPNNLEGVLKSVVQTGDLVVNLSVIVSSAELIRFNHAPGALYLDTCIEPWEGVHDAPSLSTYFTALQLRPSRPVADSKCRTGNRHYGSAGPRRRPKSSLAFRQVGVTGVGWFCPRQFEHFTAV